MRKLAESGRGLGSAVRAWEYFVAECERGYPWSIYDFDEDLTSRDTIEGRLPATAGRSPSSRPG